MELLLAWDGTGCPEGAQEVDASFHAADWLETIAHEKHRGRLRWPYQIGLTPALPHPAPDLWISENFGLPTGPAGDPWPLPANACHPPEHVPALAALRVRPEQCDAMWLSFFLPHWTQIDQDKSDILVRLACAWAEAMTLAAVAETAMREAPPATRCLVRWRFSRWWTEAGANEDERCIASRAAAFLGLLSRRVAAAAGSAAPVLTGWECGAATRWELTAPAEERAAWRVRPAGMGPAVGS